MIVKDGYIIATDKSDAQYEEILELIRNKPVAPEGYVYKLLATTLQWELCELPPIPPTPEPKSEYEEGYDDSTYDSLEDEEV